MALTSSSPNWFWFRPLVKRAEPSMKSTPPRRAEGLSALKMSKQAGIDVE